MASGDLVPIHGGRSIEPIGPGPSEQMGQQLLDNFYSRGRKAAQLVVATLTESAFTPLIDGFSVDQGTRHLLEPFYTEDEYDVKVLSEQPEIDIVAKAASTLRAWINADVPGSSQIALESYETRYRSLWRHVKPGRRTPEAQKSAFREGLVTQLSDRGVQLRSPEQAADIVRQAPLHISGLRLTDADDRWHETWHEFVTSDGRLVAVLGKVKDEWTSKYWLPRTVGNIHKRGGKQPDQDMPYRITQRITDLRTSGSRR